MTSQIATTKNAAGQWEVRRKDDERTLLGTFDNEFCRDLFVEAVLGLIGLPDHDIEPLDVAAHSRKLSRPEMAAA